MQRASAPTPFHRLTPRITAACRSATDGTHDVYDPARQLLVASAHVPDIEAAHVLTVGPFELLRKGIEELDGRRKGIDRPRVHEDERLRHQRMPRRKLDANHPADTAHDDWLLDSDLGAETGEIFGEIGDRVAVFRAVASATAAQVECRHSVLPHEVIELRLESGPVRSTSRVRRVVRACRCQPARSTA